MREVHSFMQYKYPYQARKNTKLKFISMTEEEFNIWVSNQNLYRKDGAKNSNVTRVLMWRNISLENYYGN